MYIEPGSPWENGYIESFSGKSTRLFELRDELLDREIFTTLEEAKILIEQWRKGYNKYVLITHWVTGHLLLRLSYR